MRHIERFLEEYKKSKPRRLFPSVRIERKQHTLLRTMKEVIRLRFSGNEGDPFMKFKAIQDRVGVKSNTAQAIVQAYLRNHLEFIPAGKKPYKLQNLTE